MTQLPGPAPAGGRPGARSSGDPGNRPGGLRIASVTIRLTVGGYLLAIFAAAVCALTLPAAVPGLSAVAYLAATAGLVTLVLASLAGHELAHAILARRHGASVAEVFVGFFGGISHWRHTLATARASWQVAAAGPAASLLAANLLPGAGLDGGRIVRALAWARSADPTRAGLAAAVHLGQPHLGQPAR